MPAIVPLVVAAAGAAMTAKGQSDQKKQNEATNTQTQENWDAQQKTDWDRYMMSRGVDNTSGIAGAKAINTKLPYWANVKPRTANQFSAMSVPSYKS